MKKHSLITAIAVSALSAQYSLTTYDSVVTDLGNAISLQGVEQVVTDSNGVYWFASANHGYNGLIAFDGTKWYDFSSSAVPNIGGKVNAINVAPNGDLWVGGTDIVHFDGFQWKNYRVSENLPYSGYISHWITDIDFDSLGNRYFSSEGAGSFAMSDDEFIRFDYYSYNTYRANSDVEVVRDSVYLLQRWDAFNGLKQVRYEKEVDVDSIRYAADESQEPSETVRLKKVIDLKKNRATEAPVIVQRIDSTTIEILEKREDHWFHRDFYTAKEFDKIELTPEGYVWVMADGYLQSKREGYTSYIIPESTPGLSGEVENFFLSSTGVVWLSMKERGVVMATPAAPTALGESAAVQTDLFRIANSSGRLHFSTGRSGVYAIDLIALNGRVIDRVHSGTLQAGDHSFDLSKQSLARGMYIVRVNGDLQGSSRILIQ